MNKWTPVWLVVCFAVVFAGNRALAPKVGYEMSVAQRTMPTGSLRLEGGGRSHDLKLTTLALVSDEMRPLLADPRPVRVLWIRSIDDGSGEPDLELFVDLVSGGPVVDVNAAELGFLRDRDLAVLAIGPGTTARSRVRLPGDSAPRAVRGGTVHVTRVLAVDIGEGPRSRVEGRVQLFVEGEGGAQPFDGILDARLSR